MLKNTENSTNKLILLSIAIVGILLTVVGLLYSSFALVQPVRSISFTSEKLNYEEKEPGSFQVEKSAKWIDKGKARITFDINTIRKMSKKIKDIVFVLDVSSSMKGSKLEKVKADTTELLNELLLEQQNKAALITFSREATLVSQLTNDKEEMLTSIENLSTGNGTNYYQALISLEKFLENYEYTEERECIVLFLTDGYPSIEIPNEKSYYNYLKEKYPYITINGIQYEMGSEILEPVKTVSDNQYIANINTLNNVLFETSNTSESYLNFSLSDYINTEYFEIKNIEDIKSNIGRINLDKETGKITWILDGLNTGKSVQLTIDIYLKDKEIKNFYSTNIKETVYSNQSGLVEEVTSDKTPVLKSKYQVNYDSNLPNNCSVSNVPEVKSYQVFDTVEMDNTNLKCKGYQFKGWKIITENVKRINKDYFIMPESDVTIIAEWSSLDLSKTMNGTVQEYQQPYLQSIMENYSEEMWKYKTDITKIVFQDQIKNISGAIESWDLSETNNYGVVGYLVPNVDNTTYTVYIQGENEIIANTDSSYLFDGMTSLESIEGLEYLNTTNVENMGDMFRNCQQLKELNLSHFNTSNVKYMNAMFSGCNSLTNLDLSSFDTSKVTNMRYLFYRCHSLTNIDLSSFNVSNVKYFDATFMGCISLQSLNLNNFVTTNVTTMIDMFRECAALETLDISNFDTSNVVSMDSMFRDCSMLQNLNIGSFDTSKVTNMRCMFYNCSSLISLSVEKFNTSIVVNMDSMFCGCSSLTSLDVSKFDTRKTGYMNSMFRGCSSLEGLNLNNFITTNVITMVDMFRECSNLTSLDLSNFNTPSVTNMDSMFRDCSMLQNLNIGSFDTSKVINMRYMFSNCSSLESLNLVSFDTTNVTTMEAIFSGCLSLKSLNVSNFNTSNVVTMYYMFYDCRNLTNLDLGHFNTSKVTNMNRMFRHCYLLESLDLSKFDTTNVTTMEAIFSGCLSLKSLNVSNFNTSNVVTMYHMFYDCRNLTNLDISSFDTSNVTNMSAMFYRCENLENLNLGVFDTSKVENMFSLFTYDRKVTATITISNPNITDYADIFYGTSATMGQVIVNYTVETESLVDSMIASKSSDANVVKGVLVTS